MRGLNRELAIKIFNDFLTPTIRRYGCKQADWLVEGQPCQGIVQTIDHFNASGITFAFRCQVCSIDKHLVIPNNWFIDNDDYLEAFLSYIVREFEYNPTEKELMEETFPFIEKIRKILGG